MSQGLYIHGSFVRPHMGRKIGTTEVVPDVREWLMRQIPSLGTKYITPKIEFSTLKAFFELK